MRKIRLHAIYVVAILYAATLHLLGYLLYVIARLILSFAYMLMLSPQSAKNELRDIHRIFQTFGDL